MASAHPLLLSTGAQKPPGLRLQRHPAAPRTAAARRLGHKKRAAARQHAARTAWHRGELRSLALHLHRPRYMCPHCRRCCRCTRSRPARSATGWSPRLHRRLSSRPAFTPQLNGVCRAAFADAHRSRFELKGTKGAAVLPRPRHA